MDTSQQLRTAYEAATRASQDLERFKSESTASPNQRLLNLYSHSGQGNPNRQQPKRALLWVWVIVAAFAGITVIACFGSIVLAGAFWPSPQPSSSITAQPFVLSTPTSDCTCALATGYLDKTFSRFDSISTQIVNIESASEDGSLLQLNFAAYSSEAKAIYREQLGETPPSCLQAYQNKTVSLLWNWQQTMEYAAGGQYDAVELFIQGFLDDFSALESEGERLLKKE